MGRGKSLSLALLLLFSASGTFAQQPTVQSAAVAVRLEPLPVLDDDGNVIPESLIASTMRPPSWQIRRPLLMALVGLLAFNLAIQPQGGSDCSPYEPCTPREEWRLRYGPWTGLAVGALLGKAMPDGSVDRRRAVEIIRAEQRAKKARQTP